MLAYCETPLFKIDLFKYRFHNTIISNLSAVKKFIHTKMKTNLMLIGKREGVPLKGTRFPKVLKAENKIHRCPSPEKPFL